MTTVTDALIGGLRVGSLVEIHDLSPETIVELERDVNGEIGQVTGFSAGGAEEAGRVHVCLTSGFASFFDPKCVKPKTDVHRPGAGGKEASFDLLFGPRTDPATLGNEIALRLIETGFCVLKVCHNTDQLEATMEMITDLGNDGFLARLPEEVEEGYLGNTCRGKVAWLDADDKDTRPMWESECLQAIDGNLTYIAQALQPYSQDMFGEWVDERSTALICMSLTDDEEPEYPCPEADDVTLGAFLTTYRRTLVRAVQFCGPMSCSVLLETKDSAEKLVSKPKTTGMQIDGNTILLYRPDVFEYNCDPAGETLMLIANFLRPAPQLEFHKVEGDTSWLTVLCEGPPKPPQKDHLWILNSTARLPANWDNAWAETCGLAGACDAVVKIPMMRSDVDLYWTPDEDKFETWQTTTKHQSYCEAAEQFDNKHFEISNAEAGGMDPVQRLICEAGCQSLALMGLTKKICNRKAQHAGCAVGNDKLDWMTCDKPACQIGASMGGTSTVLAIIANRFNFLFNMKGPSFVCDTACSASISSSHCVKMMMLDRRYDAIDWFLSMGAHLCLSLGPFIGCSQSHMSSPKGRCFTFNASADGYLRGEGISGFMCKFGDYSEDAWCIFRSSAIGQDGRSASLTAPNGPAQEEIITKAIKEGLMIPPESTNWDTHGTGTSLGDPIEVGAIRKVQVRMPRVEPLLIGSTKTNIGHLEGGAAMASISKCIVQCKYAKCYPTLHCRTLNPHLEHAAFEAVFQTENSLMPYVQGHAQISSFGFGGANGHACFWGHDVNVKENYERMIRKKLAMRGHPEVRVLGKDPDEWEADFPDFRKLKPGAKISVTIEKDKKEDEKLVWQVINDGDDNDKADDDVYFCISGNFNDWDDDRMAAGDVSGLHTATVETPDSGVIEFRILKEGERDQIIAPATPNCGWRAEQILGPDKDLANKWAIKSMPGTEVRIEFFYKAGMKAIVWLGQATSGE